MSTGDSWRELYRTDDVREALSLAMTIAAMEFEVQWCGLGRTSGNPDDDSPGEPPYIIEVREADWFDLRSVLESILDEQAEFDARFDRRREVRQMIAFITLILLAVIPVLLAFVAHLTQFSRHHRHSQPEESRLAPPPPALLFVHA